MRTFVYIGALLALAVFSGFELYHQTGMVHATKKNGLGCICHSFDPTPAVRVWISGPDSLRAGSVGVFRINVARQGSIAAGFNVAAFRGSLGIEDTAGTQLESESSIDSLELTHTLPRMANGRDTISWLFRYKAPSTAGIVDTIYSAGNSVNNDTLPDGDFWNFGDNFRVRILTPTAAGHENIVENFQLHQNYPNPFNPSTLIQYEIPDEGNVMLEVFDAAGRKVSTLVNTMQSRGAYAAAFTPANGGFASGVYLYRMTWRSSQSEKSQTSVRKMLFMK